jgi:hypothetical protein
MSDIASLSVKVPNAAQRVSAWVLTAARFVSDRARPMTRGTSRSNSTRGRKIGGGVI